MAGLKLKGVTKAFGLVKVIHGVDLEIADGEFVVLVGPSGCGKSTLLRIISGLESASSGQIFIGLDDVTTVDPAERGAAMVFQSYALYPHMTVRQNIGFGLRMAGMPKDQVSVQVEQAATMLELTDLLDRKPKALSGGQRQRVAIGRAIVRDPKLFLFDEPLSNLDAELRVQMRLEIAQLHHRMGATMVFVTHDQVEAMTLADRIVVLRDGRVEQVGTPIELYDNPANQFVAGFIGSPRMNFLGGKVDSVGPDGAVISLTDFNEVRVTVSPATADVKPGEPVQVGLRPEHIQTADPLRPVLSAEVQVVEQLGSMSCLYLARPGGGTVIVMQPGHSAAKAGSMMQVGIDPAKCLLFDLAGQRL
ncbi:MAG: sn-glycerol-3-phosphate ABC transporter ATP-binding protein UgpC [bacterium]